jgi:hypothetical protein
VAAGSGFPADDSRYAEGYRAHDDHHADQYTAGSVVGLGAALGFIAAATVAVNTLSSPIGPVFSTALIGVGALVGARR